MASELPNSPGTVYFYLPKNSNTLTWLVEGGDNKNLLSLFALKEGVIGFPTSLDFFHIWLNSAYSKPELHGLKNLFVESSGDSIGYKEPELRQLFAQWLHDTPVGTVKAETNTCEINAINSTKVTAVCQDLLNRGFVTHDTKLIVNGNESGDIGSICVETLDDPWDISVRHASQNVEHEVALSGLLSFYRSGKSTEQWNRMCESVVLRFIFKNHRRLVTRAAEKVHKKRRLSSSQQSMDISGVLLKISKSVARSYDPKKGRLSTYVGFISYSATDKLVNAESDSSLEYLPEVPHDDRKAVTAGGSVKTAALWKYVGETAGKILEPREYRIFVDHAYNKKKFDVIASELAISPSMCKHVYSVALNLLRQTCDAENA